MLTHQPTLIFNLRDDEDKDAINDGATADADDCNFVDDTNYMDCDDDLCDNKDDKSKFQKRSGTPVNICICNFHFPFSVCDNEDDKSRFQKRSGTPVNMHSHFLELLN